MSTTSSLVVDNFQTPDNGNYVCQARDGMMTVNSFTLSLTGECGCESTVVITDALFLKICGQDHGLFLAKFMLCAYCMVIQVHAKYHELTCIQAVEMLTHRTSRLMSCELS